MKKTISVLLSVMMIMTVAVTAFATETKTELKLGVDSDTNASLEGAYLLAGENYLYPVLLATGENEAPLTDELLDNYSFKLVNTGKSESLEEIKLKKSGEVYFLSVRVKNEYPSIISEEEYSMKLVGRGSGKDTLELAVSFETGAQSASDDYIASLKKGDEVETDNDAPLYTAEQLRKIAELNEHKKVVFTGRNWILSANVSDMQGLNLYSDTDSHTEILAKYPDNDFAFLNFRSGDRFVNFAEIELDVSDFAEDFLERFYVYRYEDGKLIPTTASYDTEDGSLTISTRALSRFVITDKAIGDRVVEVLGESDLADGVTENPNTGAAA